MPLTRTTISFTREGMQLIQEPAKRQGPSVSPFVREPALMRATMAADDNPTSRLDGRKPRLRPR